MKKVLIMSIILTGCFLYVDGVQKTYSPSQITRVVFLGTGTPNPDPEHSGNSIAIIVRNTPYIVDCGPGLVRKAASLSTRYGGVIEALNAPNLKRVFLTHLHSDHTSGLPDLILTPWVMGRDEPLMLFGPVGSKKMVKYLLKAYQADRKIRLYGLEHANNQGWRVVVREVDEGIVYKDENVMVEAFRVKHGNWAEAFGYKFMTPDRSIVISGDTAPCENIIRKSKGVDILIHEVYSHRKLKDLEEKWKFYHPKFHTSTIELAEIAKRTNPGILILYHQLYWGIGDDELLNEIAGLYHGLVVSAQDLDVY
jgi:ribonuclease Z